MKVQTAVSMQLQRDLHNPSRGIRIRSHFGKGILDSGGTYLFLVAFPTLHDAILHQRQTSLLVIKLNTGLLPVHSVLGGIDMF